jgi:hypothetical protein
MAEDTKLGLARSIATSLRDKLAEVLIVAMFLGVGLYLGRDVGGALVSSLNAIAAQMGAMAQGMTIVIERSTSEQAMRSHEHDELQTDLKECMEMGHALAECQQRERRK